MIWHLFCVQLHDFIFEVDNCADPVWEGQTYAIIKCAKEIKNEGWSPHEDYGWLFIMDNFSVVKLFYVRFNKNINPLLYVE